MKTRLLYIIGLQLVLLYPASAGSLSLKDAELLVLNTPDVIKAKRIHHCPKAEYLFGDENTAAFQVRNVCPSNGSGLIGNYSVDLRTGFVRYDLEGRRIDSERLRKLRHQLLSRGKAKQGGKPKITGTA